MEHRRSGLLAVSQPLGLVGEVEVKEHLLMLLSHFQPL